jgi:hypothetical protein
MNFAFQRNSMEGLIKTTAIEENANHEHTNAHLLPEYPQKKKKKIQILLTV